MFNVAIDWQSYDKEVFLHMKSTFWAILKVRIESLGIDTVRFKFKTQTPSEKEKENRHQREQEIKCTATRENRFSGVSSQV